MPNKDINKKIYKIPKKFVNALGKDISGNNLTTKKSRLENKEYLTKEEEEALEWINKTYNKKKEESYHNKDIQRKNGKKNAFKEEHTKDNKNTNVGKPGGLAKLNSDTKVSKQLEDNMVQYYESFNKEIKNMIYLIEYMDNNKNKII